MTEPIEIIANILILTFGLLVSLGNLKIIWGHKKSKNWGKVKGIIHKSYIDKSSLHFYENIAKGNENFIEYEYFIENKKYLSRNIFNTDNGDISLKYAQKLLAKFPPNKSLTVYYNKDNVQESYIESTSIIGSYIYMTIGIIFLAYSLDKLLVL